MECANCQHDLGDATARTAFICAEVAGDEYIYSYWRCHACGFYTLETYRDRFTGSADVTVGAPIDPEEGDAIAEYIRRCPNPADKRCRCEVHRWAGGESRNEPPPAAPSQGKGAGDSPGANNGIGPYSSSGPALLTCPACGKRTDSLKRYGVMHEVVFLGFYARSRRRGYTACPKCMRRMVLKDTFSPMNILLANLMWVLAVFPYCLALLVASTIPGHSGSVRRTLQGDE